MRVEWMPPRPENLAQYRRSEFERWRKLIAQMKLKVN